MRAVLVKSAGLTRACWAARVCKGREGNEERTIHCNEERTIQHWAVSQLLNGNHGNGSHGNGSHGNGSHGSGSHGSGSHGSGMSQRERRAPLLLSSPRPVLKLHTRASRRATGQGRTGDRAQGRAVVEPRGLCPAKPPSTLPPRGGARRGACDR